MKNDFFNTINLYGEALSKENARAVAQGVLVKEIFLANPRKKFSPSQIHEVFKKKYFLYPPLTSIRRAMCNLTIEGVLSKTGEKITGQYHLPEHLWMLDEKKKSKRYRKDNGR